VHLRPPMLACEIQRAVFDAGSDSVIWLLPGRRAWGRAYDPILGSYLRPRECPSSPDGGTRVSGIVDTSPRSVVDLARSLTGWWRQPGHRVGIQLYTTSPTVYTSPGGDGVMLRARRLDGPFESDPSGRKGQVGSVRRS
jgi:hypothetical protein